MKIELRLVLIVAETYDLQIATAWLADMLEKSEPGPRLVELYAEELDE